MACENGRELHARTVWRLYTGAEEWGPYTGAEEWPRKWAVRKRVGKTGWGAEQVVLLAVLLWLEFDEHEKKAEGGSSEAQDTRREVQ